MDFLYPRLPGFRLLFEPNVAEASADQPSAENLAQAMQESAVKAVRDSFAEGPTATRHTILKHEE